MAKDPRADTRADTRAQHPSGGEANLAAAAASASAGTGEPMQVVWTMARSAPVDTITELRRKPRVTVAFPPCAGELLALIRTGDRDDVTRCFNDYFKFQRHRIFGQHVNGEPREMDEQLNGILDDSLLKCEAADAHTHGGRHAWPSDCCLCPPCVTLDGRRHLPETATEGLRRLFIADVLWLFFYERLGVHQVLGVILDAYANNGRLPISNGSLDGSSPRDHVISLVLEVMVRQTKMGLSSTVRDRGATYRTSLGWQSKAGAGLNLDTQVNNGFSSLFHRLIYTLLEFYRDKRLAVAIQTTAAPVGRPSIATVTAIANTIDVLRKRFEAFAYGRNYYNTLAGIVWTIAGMSVIRDLRTTLGIPPAYNEAYEFVPAAYDILVLKRPVTQGDVNPYLEHQRCAENGRDILLDLEVVSSATGPGLENWLDQIEPKVEAYRTAYRNLTGIDLGASATPTIEHQA